LGGEPIEPQPNDTIFVTSRKWSCDLLLSLSIINCFRKCSALFRVAQIILYVVQHKMAGAIFVPMFLCFYVFRATRCFYVSVEALNC